MIYTCKLHWNQSDDKPTSSAGSEPKLGEAKAKKTKTRALPLPGLKRAVKPKEEEPHHRSVLTGPNGTGFYSKQAVFHHVAAEQTETIEPLKGWPDHTFGIQMAGQPTALSWIDPRICSFCKLGEDSVNYF